MTIKNTRQKGRKVVTFAIPLLRKYDEKSYETVGSGQGTRDKGDVRMPTFKATLEYKNTQQISAEAWLHEVEKDCNMQGDRYGIVVWRCPQSPESNPDFHSAIDTWTLMELLQDSYNYRQLSDEEKELSNEDNHNENRELKWALTALKNAINKVLKLIK